MTDPYEGFTGESPEEAAYEAGWKQGLKDARAAALREAAEAARRQTALASLVAGRPTDFEKGVMSCVAAIEALL